MTDREELLADIRAAGYHRNLNEWTRLREEAWHRVSFVHCEEAWTQGCDARDTGLPCPCYRCQPERTAE